jgi:hypothetical protein
LSSALALVIAQGVLISALDGCGPRGDGRAPPTQVHRNEVRYGLSFEERMAIPPALSRLRGAAQRRADEIYDPFRSREDAVRNEEYFARLLGESRADLLAAQRLTEADVQQIIAEYQASLGANLR